MKNLLRLLPCLFLSASLGLSQANSPPSPGAGIGSKVMPLTPANTPTFTMTGAATSTPTITSTPTSTATPTLTATETPNPCSYPYGVTQVGDAQTGQGVKGRAYESPLSLSCPVTAQEIHFYSSQAETITVGVYNSSNSLLKSVTFFSKSPGWCSEDFAITLRAGKYYLGRYGTGTLTNLAGGAGAGSYYDASGNLPKSFDQNGREPSLGTPVYLTACNPQTVTGILFGIGDSTMYGEGLGGWTASHRFLTLFGDWLNANYGPVSIINMGLPGMLTYQLPGSLENLLPKGKTIRVCVFEVGEKNFEDNGNPNNSVCGGESLVDGLSSALVFADQTQSALSTIKKHMDPDGVLILMNFYQLDDVMEAMHPGWKDYRAILSAYNNVVALLAKANNAKLIDLYSLVEANPSYKQVLGVHISPSGHYAVAELLKQAIESGNQAALGKK